MSDNMNNGNITSNAAPAAGPQQRAEQQAPQASVADASVAYYYPMPAAPGADEAAHSHYYTPIYYYPVPADPQQPSAAAASLTDPEVAAPVEGVCYYYSVLVDPQQPSASADQQEGHTSVGGGWYYYPSPDESSAPTDSAAPTPVASGCYVCDIPPAQTDNAAAEPDVEYYPIYWPDNAQFRLVCLHPDCAEGIQEAADMAEHMWAAHGVRS